LGKRNSYKDVVSARKTKEEELVNMIALDKVDIQVKYINIATKI